MESVASVEYNDYIKSKEVQVEIKKKVNIDYVGDIERIKMYLFLDYNCEQCHRLVNTNFYDVFFRKEKICEFFTHLGKNFKFRIKLGDWNGLSKGFLSDEEIDRLVKKESTKDPSDKTVYYNRFEHYSVDLQNSPIETNASCIPLGGHFPMLYIVFKDSKGAIHFKTFEGVAVKITEHGEETDLLDLILKAFSGRVTEHLLDATFHGQVRIIDGAQGDRYLKYERLKVDEEG